jgi:hypothetical protein
MAVGVRVRRRVACPAGEGEPRSTWGSLPAVDGQGCPRFPRGEGRGLPGGPAGLGRGRGLGIGQAVCAPTSRTAQSWKSSRPRAFRLESRTGPCSGLRTWGVVRVLQFHPDLWASAALSTAVTNGSTRGSGGTSPAWEAAPQ